jgi:hypothetical protein
MQLYLYINPGQFVGGQIVCGTHSLNNGVAVPPSPPVQEIVPTTSTPVTAVVVSGPEPGELDVTTSVDPNDGVVVAPAPEATGPYKYTYTSLNDMIIDQTVDTTTVTVEGLLVTSSRSKKSRSKKRRN